MEVTKDISKYCELGTDDNKVKIQKLMFHMGIIIDPIKRQYRTSKVNQVFSVIQSISIDNKTKSKNAPSDLDDASSLVTGTLLRRAMEDRLDSFRLFSVGMGQNRNSPKKTSREKRL